MRITDLLKFKMVKTRDIGNFGLATVPSAIVFLCFRLKTVVNRTALREMGQESSCPVCAALAARPAPIAVTRSCDEISHRSQLQRKDRTPAGIGVARHERSAPTLMPQEFRTWQSGELLRTSRCR